MITLAEAKRTGKLVRFPTGNKARFFQDFAIWEGAPSDVDLYDTGEEDSQGWHIMVGAGHGVSGDYGNGSLFVRPDDIPGFKAEPLSGKAKLVIDTVNRIKEMADHIGCDFTLDSAKLKAYGLSQREINRVRYHTATKTTPTGVGSD